MPADSKVPPDNGLPVQISVPKGYSPLNSAGMALANLGAWHLIRIGGSGILAEAPENISTQPLGTVANPILAAQRPWISEPMGSIPFDEQGAYNFTGTATAGNVPVVTMLVPNGFDGVIKWISNNLVGGSSFQPGNVVWQIQINGRPVRNFGNMIQEKGTIAQGRQVSPIRIFSTDVVTYTVREAVNGLTGSTVCSLAGYFFPSKGIS
jgi:hypothetical protein